eukprot:3261984-Rhodomonas_salina.2
MVSGASIATQLPETIEDYLEKSATTYIHIVSPRSSECGTAHWHIVRGHQDLGLVLQLPERLLKRLEQGETTCQETSTEDVAQRRFRQPVTGVCARWVTRDLRCARARQPVTGVCARARQPVTGVP